MAAVGLSSEQARQQGIAATLSNPFVCGGSNVCRAILPYRPSD